MKRTALESWICELEGLPALTRPALEALQLTRLNGLLARERARGGFYRGLPAALDGLEGLRGLPFTTAADLAARAGDLLLVSQAEVSRVVTGATSGTTGPAKRLFYTARDLAHTVGFFAAGISELVAPGDTVMIAMPFSGPFGLGELIAAAVERLGARPLRTGYGPAYGALAAQLDAEAPSAYIGMPAPLLGLLRWYAHSRGRPAPLRRALVSGDACPTPVAAAIEGLLGTRLFPHYGARELCLGGAVTCAAHAGMHLRENHLIAEIVDENGAPLPDGALGELVVTTLDMEALPLLRYRTGDRACILPGPCPCGGVTRRLDAVSRLAPAERAMPALDALAFPLPGLVDLRAARTPEGLAVEALWAGPPDAAALRARLPAAARLSCRAATAEDGPLYAGKRVLAGAEA